MKKCGRFVAGMFGTSLSLAMLSGAFLMANKGAVEAEAADGDVVISLSNDDFGRSGTNAVLTAEKDRVSFEGKFRTTSTGGTDYQYLMFDKGGSYLTNTSTLAGYYVSNISWTYTKGTGESGKVYYSFLDSSNNTVSTVGSAIEVVQEGTKSFTNDDQSLGYFNISNSNANVQFETINVTFSPTTSYDHITISGEPTKTQYYVGDAFLTDGLTVNAYKTAEDTNPTDVTDLVEWMIDPEVFDDTSTTSVDVLVSFGDLTSDIYTVDGLTVLPAATVTDLVITGPTKTTYGYGEAIDLSGLKIEAKMSDGKTNDVTSEIEIAAHTIGLADVAAGKYDINVSYKGVNKTISLTVEEEVSSIAEFRALADKGNGIFSGTVTAVFKTNDYTDNLNAYVHSADGTGVLVYNIAPNKIVGELKVGQKVFVKADKTTFNGLVETNGVDELYVAGAGETITPKVINSAAELVHSIEGAYVSLSGLTYISGTAMDGDSAGDIVLAFGDDEIAMRSQNAEAAMVLDEAGLDDWFAKTSGLPFNFTGVLGWYTDKSGTVDRAQLAPTSMSEFTCPVYDEIKTFIDTYMHMSENTANQCLTLFPEAEEAFNKLSETARNCFLNYEGDNQEIVSASARYHAWSVAVGDQNAASVIMNTVNENKGTIIAVSAVAALGIAGAAALLISRKKRSAKNK